MLNPQHEMLHRLFQVDKGLYSRAMKKVYDIDVAVPDEAVAVSTDFTILSPDRTLERHGDTALLLTGPGGSRRALLIESQGKREDDCEYNWPLKAAYMRSWHRCPVNVVVVTAAAATARWARDLWDGGAAGEPCLQLSKVVFGPDNTAPVMDAAEARSDPVFATLAALINRTSRKVQGILEVLADAFTTYDDDTANYYSAMVETGLGEKTSAGRIWRSLMASERFPYATALEVKSKAEGKAEGKAEDVLEILEVRGVPVEPGEKERIQGCRDLAKLGQWIKQAVTVSSAAELFTA